MEVIERVTLLPYRVPFVASFGTASTTHRERCGVIVSAKTSSGLVGVGEAAPLDADVDYKAFVAALTAEAWSLPGTPPAAAWKARLDAPGRADEAGRAIAAALDTVIADLGAREAGMPLWRWLAPGGTDTTATVPVNAVIDTTAPAKAASQARACVAEGYGVLKLKVGAGDDVARVRAVRVAVGPDAMLRLDANGAWKDAPQALSTLHALAQFDIEYCEEPLANASARREELARIARQSPVPVAVDESCRSKADLDAVIAMGAASTIVIKPTLTGLVVSGRMARTAMEAGLQVVVTTALDAGVGTRMSAHVAASLPPPRPACGLDTLSLLEHPLVSRFPAIAGGVMVLDQSPGLGVDLDDDAMSRYAAGPPVEIAS